MRQRQDFSLILFGHQSPKLQQFRDLGITRWKQKRNKRPRIVAFPSVSFAFPETHNPWVAGSSPASPTWLPAAVGMRTMIAGRTCMARKLPGCTTPPTLAGTRHDEKPPADREKTGDEVRAAEKEDAGPEGARRQGQEEEEVTRQRTGVDRVGCQVISCGRLVALQQWQLTGDGIDLLRVIRSDGEARPSWLAVELGLAAVRDQVDYQT